MNDQFDLLERIEELTSQRVHARTECPQPLYERKSEAGPYWISEHFAWAAARDGQVVRRVR